MRVSHHTKGFRRDYVKLQRSGWKISKLDAVVDLLIDGKVLPQKNRDHALQGEWQGVRDCHIEGDWILLYELHTDSEGKKCITFHATGTHENLFV